MSDRLKLIIGGTASSGSSLLVHYLNNHSKIYCGPETNMFCHPDWYMNWDKVKADLSSKKLDSIMSKGWHIHKGTQIEHLLPSEKSDRYIKQSIDYKEFIHNLFHHVIKNSSKELFVEKTPSNAICFPFFNSVFPNTKKVLTIRNPYNAIASMYKRGWTVPYAAGLYLFNIGMGYVRDGSDLHIIKYENLIQDNEKELSELLETIDLSTEPRMWQEEKEMEVLPTWVQSNDMIKSGTSTFELLSDSEQSCIAYFIDGLKFKPNFKFYGKSPYFKSIKEISLHFDYESYIGYSEGKFQKSKYRTHFSLEKMKRKLKNYPLSGKDFPFKLQKF